MTRAMAIALLVLAACLFVIAQLVAWLVFKQVPSTAVWLGGGFIVTGGVIVAMSRA